MGCLTATCFCGKPDCHTARYSLLWEARNRLREVLPLIPDRLDYAGRNSGQAWRDIVEQDIARISAALKEQG